MSLVDPRPVHVGQGFNVHIACQKRRLEAPHLDGGRCLSFDGLDTNDPPPGGITSETLGVVYAPITTKASKHRLTERPRHAVPSVLAGSAVLESMTGNFSQAKSAAKFPISEQPGVRGDLGTIEFKLQVVAKIDPEFDLLYSLYEVCHFRGRDIQWVEITRRQAATPAWRRAFRSIALMVRLGLAVLISAYAYGQVEGIIIDDFFRTDLVSAVSTRWRGVTDQAREIQTAGANVNE